MATRNEIDASTPNKLKLEETQSEKITVNFGIFFDGTNNQRLQVAMGKLNREKNAEKKKEKIKKKIASLDGTFDEDQYEKNGSIQYTFKNNPSSDKEKEIEKLNKKIAKYNKKFGNRLDDNERDTIETFSWDNASGEKKDEDTIEQSLRNKSGFRIGMPRSFMQGVDFTNIARLEPLYDFNQNDATTYKYRIYVSGSGTFADVNKGMDVTGLAFGQGSAGVVQKVKDALDAITEKIEAIKCNGNIEEVNYKINVFGFSRGATEARLFIDLFSARRAGKRHKILSDLIREYNKKFVGKEDNTFISFPGPKTTLEFPFVGVYDTVSSVGVTPGIWNSAIASKITKGIENISNPASKYHEKNKEELGLDTLVYDNKVKHVVHICALDEFRENFALQVMPSNILKVEQFFIPGIHTDIGGGDLDGYDEEKYIAKTHKNIVLYMPKIVTPGERQKKSDLFIINKENLQQLGWIKDSTNSSLISDIVKEEKDIIRTQRYSEHGYAYLPLTILAKKACENTCKFENLEDKYSIPDDLPQSFDAMKTAWAGADSKYGHCYFPKEDSKYKLLRQRFLHFSSNIKKTAGLVYVNGPNLTGSNDGKNSVLYYDRFLDYNPQGWYGDINSESLNWEDVNNGNPMPYIGEAVVIFDTTEEEEYEIVDGKKYISRIIDERFSDQCLLDENMNVFFDLTNKKNAKVTIYGTKGQIKSFQGATIPYDTEKNTLLEGDYLGFYQDMASSAYGSKGGSLSYRIAQRDYLVSHNEKHLVLMGTSGKTMTEIFLHRTNRDGNASLSSKGCLLIDGRQWTNVEELLGKSNNIYIRINRKRKNDTVCSTQHLMPWQNTPIS